MPVWLTTIFARVTGSVVKSGAEATKAVVEVPKVLVETEKARLEVLKLRDEQADRRSPITPATMDDVMKFDPKVGLLTKLAEQQFEELNCQVAEYPDPDTSRHRTMFIVILVAIAFALLVLAAKVI